MAPQGARGTARPAPTHPYPAHEPRATLTITVLLIRRNVTELAGKVYVNLSATPLNVDVTGATGCPSRC